MKFKRQITAFLPGLLCSLTLAWGTFISPSCAAGRVTLRLGPFQQSIAVSDLEAFAKTGELPAKLQLFAPLFTSQVREMLQRRLEVDPNVGDKVIDELMRSPSGKRILESLGDAIPGSTVEGVRGAIALALRQANGLNVISFLRAYPGEEVTIDASSAIPLLLQFNPRYWQSQAIGALLENDLAVNTNTNFTANFDPAAPGKQNVREKSLRFTDRQRNRIIPVDIYYSATPNASNPLVVISHGFGADRRFLAYIARHLASDGVTVAAIEHPGSNSTAVYKAADAGELQKLLPAAEFINAPKDVSFLLDELAKLNTQAGELQGQLNTDSVSVIGHSLGGYTALALVGGEVELGELQQFCRKTLSVSEAPGDWLQCAAADLKERKLQLEDGRVKSAIALNPLVGKLFGKSGLNQVTKPVLILSSTQDTLTPAVSHQLRPFTQLRGNKYLVTAIGATHLSVADPGINLTDIATASTLVPEKRGTETNSLRRLTQGVTLAFIKQLTPEASIYAPFLSPAYAQSLSTSEIPLRLSSDLPGSVKSWLDMARRLSDMGYA